MDLKWNEGCVGITPGSNKVMHRQEYHTSIFQDGQGTSGQAQEHPRDESPFLVLDYETNADSLGGQGKTSPPGLRDQLARIFETHPCAVAKSAGGGRDLLHAFFQELFPDGLPAWVLLSNISLSANTPIICVRHREIGPRLAELIPAGVTFAVSGQVRQVGPYAARQAALVISRLRVMSQSPARQFESEVHVLVNHYSRSALPRVRLATANILAEEKVHAMPLISVTTHGRLADWRDYLNWKEKLIKSRIDGVRYVRAEFDVESGYRFLCVWKTVDELSAARKLFRMDELQAFPLEYSTDSWTFAYNEQERTRTKGVLGDHAETSPTMSPTSADIENCPWQSPIAAWVRFRLADDTQNELEQLMASEEDEAEVRAQLLRRIPQNGFLALSAIGDIALVVRQRRELENLEEQSGYAPFLTSYLFDIKAANVPSHLTEITDDQWMRKDLNDDQRLAVRKMISTPDLGLVQGPPGTGKTTMIAEAAYQFVRQGKKVLVASQANLAVDNVLERLSATPHVRAVRLGRRGEKDNPFSQAKTLSTYYRTVAEACRKGRLDPWIQAESEHEALSAWLNKVEMIRADWDQQVQCAASLEDECSRHSEELDRMDREIQERVASRKLINAAHDWIESVQRSDDWNGILPDSVLSLFHEKVVPPLERLEEVGIKVNSLWSQRDYGTVSQRSRFAERILSRWFVVESFISHIKGDLDRLQSMEGDSVLSAEKAAELAGLKQEELVVREAMVNDESQLGKWQQLRLQVKNLERAAFGLDSSAYQQIFDGQVNGQPAGQYYAAPGIPKADVINRLEIALSALSSCRGQVSSGMATLTSHIAGLGERNDLDEKMPDRHLSLVGRLRACRAQSREAQEAAAAKEARLQKLLEEQGEAPDATSSSLHTAVARATLNVTERCVRLKAQLDECMHVRTMWRPILEEWVNDLVDPATVHNDELLFQDAFIRSCNVVGVTCNEKRQTLEDYGHTYFDVVVVDEVSKATPVEIVMPLMLARTGLLVGDHRQLPPLFREAGGSFAEAVAEGESDGHGVAGRDPSATELTEENLDRYRRQVTASLFKEHFENAPAELKSFLLTQYRMHPSIMNVVNRFYENRLKCGLINASTERGHDLTLVSETGNKYLLQDQHVLWLDSTTDPLGQEHYERRDGGTSKSNDLEALLIARCLIDIDEALQRQGYGRGSKPRKQVGVITFYGRQVKSIRQYVQRLNDARGHRFVAIDLDINTVDRYQGQERSIVLVSMVRNPPWRLSARANTAQYERINVAFSRAQELLVIVGAAKVFADYPVRLPNLDRPGETERDVYGDIIGELQRDGAVLQSRYVLSRETYSRHVTSSRLSQSGESDAERGA